MKDISDNFSVGDKVFLVGLGKAGIVEKVIPILLESDLDSRYRVSYYLNGNRKVDCFLERELRKLAEVQCSSQPQDVQTDIVFDSLR